MPRRFFTRRIPIVHNVAMLLLCIIFFLLPFALRGARFALDGMQNNVADWLPKNFQETVDLVEFRKYFIGDQFVVISGPWCREGNPAYDNLKRKIFEESLAYEKELRAQNNQERIRAMHAGDKYGLLYAGNFHEEWGQYRERWLKGSGGKWFFINRNGELYEWHGQNNVVEGFSRMLERMANGRNQAVGTLIDTFGPPPDDSLGQSNPYYENPQLICARAFKSVTSGPEAFEQMAGKNGTLRIGKFGEEDAVTLEAKIEAHKRLTGALFGPTPPEKFSWTFDSLLQNIDDKVLISQLKNDAIFRTKFEKFIEHQIGTEFSGDRTKLEATDADGRLAMWYRMWDAMDLEAPSRQTCLIATINDPFLTELDRIVGRPLMGKPRGRLLELATGECGLDKENVHLGGPPVDNVSIDEEGSSSLLKLASLSGLVGIILSYYAFRSIRVTLMLFFVGSMSAISSLAYVWFGGDRLDAILLTMPSLVYVLAMAGSVHMVHYYKHAVEKDGRKRAVETALRYGWFPCFLVAFTDSIALFSLCTSNLKPIYHFGLYSGIATLGTLFFIYAFLPSALTIWPPHYHREPKKEEKDPNAPEPFSRRFWGGLCDFVTRNHVPIVAVSAVALVICLFGVAKIKTTVQLLKLFDKNAKILQDYRWMEANVGKLVPMEVVLTVDVGSQREGWVDRQRKPSEETESKLAGNGGNEQPQVAVVGNAAEEPVYDKLEYNLKYSFLERLELSQRVRRHLERFFGPTGMDIVGSGMSTDVFVPMQNVNSQVETNSNLNPRKAFNTQLIASRPAMLAEDYLEITDTKVEPEVGPAYYTEVPEYNGREMWRISLRLAGLNDVDYGHFVHNLKMVVEPIVKAYEFRTTILKEIQAGGGEASLTEGRILLLGRNPDGVAEKLALERQATAADLQRPYDQAYLFADTLQDLLENRGYEPKAGKKAYMWIDPTWYTAENPFPANERWADHLRKFDCVVLVEDHSYFDSEFIKQNSKLVVDCRAHRFDIDLKKSSQNLPLTAMQRKIEKGQGHLDVAAIYTGIVPIVYKAQGALLSSLIESTAWSFGSIALIMMILLRKWNGRMNPGNWINFRGGLVAMVPNVFPIILVFGIIGFLGIRVDIGSMMTASVAMGIAVDDTIHFMNWYVRGMDRGMNRKQAIKFAYTSCADGMAQTGLIVGCGLFVFALSTFAPTQKFGVLMLVLLNAATLGDLLLLPALLAGPLGKYVCAESPRSQVQPISADSVSLEPANSELDDDEIHVIAIPSVGQQASRNPETPQVPFGSNPKDKKRFGKQ